MRSLKTLAIAGVSSLALVSSAFAADLLPPLPPPPAFEPAPVQFSGFYLRGDVGEGNLQLRNNVETFGGPVTNFSHYNDSVDAAVIFGLGVGYQFNNWLRADITGEYRSEGYRATETASGCNGAGPCVDAYGATFHHAVFLANGYADLGTYYNTTFYVGAGVGTSINTFGGLTDYNLTNIAQPGAASGFASSHTSASFAYALMAGFSYSLTSNLKLDVGYRYLDMGRMSSNAIVCNAGCSLETQHYHAASNDIRLGLRYVFADVPPAPVVDMPLVRKY